MVPFFQNFQKPLHMLTILVSADVLLEVLHIKVRNSGQNDSKFLFVDEFKTFRGYDLVEALKERSKLFLDLVDHLPLAHEFHVLLLVILGDLFVSASGNQVYRANFAERILLVN